MKVSTRLQIAWQLLKETVKAYANDQAMLLGAGIAYYALFSLAPILVIAITISGVFFGEQAAQGILVNEIQAFVGDAAAHAIQELIANARTSRATGWATAVSAFLLLLGAHIVFAQLQQALNAVWHVHTKRTKDFRAWLRDRALSFLMVFCVGALFFASLLFTAIVAAVSNWFGHIIPGWSLALRGIDFLLSLGLVTGLVAAIYKVLPDARVEWRDVWVGAFATATLLYVGKTLFSFYLTRAGVASAYGAAGSLVVLILWIYYSAQIFLLGAEFTQVYSRRFGSAIDLRFRLPKQDLKDAAAADLPPSGPASGNQEAPAEE